MYGFSNLYRSVEENDELKSDNDIFGYENKESNEVNLKNLFSDKNKEIEDMQDKKNKYEKNKKNERNEDNEENQDKLGDKENIKEKVGNDTKNELKEKGKEKQEITEERKKGLDAEENNNVNSVEKQKIYNIAHKKQDEITKYSKNYEKLNIKDKENKEDMGEKKKNEVKEKDTVEQKNIEIINQVKNELIKKNDELNEDENKGNIKYEKGRYENLVMQLSDQKNMNLIQGMNKKFTFPSLSPTDVLIPGKENENITMYHFNPEKFGYKYNNGLKPSEGYLLIYPHISHNSIPPKIKKKKIGCC
ncbi:conserved Plasmodium protein, unknown function [Plasmodium relictum]|uniref:Uncharacterized protein n=1 Tax=Plasmodium relictum TaxID=85471 RepID=A0A1J1H959_PLARL|nr:conserved Plasmodium protein, unknown function [Plasmodium relictum]CRH01047.1 conserved Plasmodium protein, unknown function [Plasmodium relictum]